MISTILKPFIDVWRAHFTQAIHKKNWLRSLFVVVKTILIMKHERYLNMQAFRLRKSNITTRRCFGVKNMLKQVNQKSNLSSCLSFSYHITFSWRIKPTEAFIIFPHNVVHSPLKIVIINRHSSTWLMIL